MLFIINVISVFTKITNEKLQTVKNLFEIVKIFDGLVKLITIIEKPGFDH